uniref:Uncharacterized protein n=1 Tax=Bursaphelenchus xylophilus TaxID=6326 RepID=A0A1I7S8G0_BURXY
MNPNQPNTSPMANSLQALSGTALPILNNLQISSTANAAAMLESSNLYSNGFQTMSSADYANQMMSTYTAPGINYPQYAYSTNLANATLYGQNYDNYAAGTVAALQQAGVAYNFNMGQLSDTSSVPQSSSPLEEELSSSSRGNGGGRGRRNREDGTVTFTHQELVS